MNELNLQLLKTRIAGINAIEKQVYSLGSFAAQGHIPEGEFVKAHELTQNIKKTRNYLIRRSLITRNMIREEEKALDDFDRAITNFRSLHRHAEYEQKFFNNLKVDYERLKKTLKKINEILES